MSSTYVYSTLLAIYIFVMWRTPQREPEENDKKIHGEERFLRIAMVLFSCWWISFLLPFFTPSLSCLPPLPFAIAGTIIFVAGSIIRTAAIRTLGSNFTYKLCIREKHDFVQSGLYRYIRHPSYTGTLLEAIGMMVAARSLYGLTLFLLSATLLFIFRFYREERMLVREFGPSYIKYQQNTKRLIPWLF